jgi:hypothetical protein
MVSKRIEIIMKNEEKEKRRGGKEELEGEGEVEEVQIKARSSPGDPSRVKST